VVVRARRARAATLELMPVDSALLWARLELTATQLAALVGVSRRQVTWWRQRGYLIPSPGATDRFGGNAVELAVLMKQAMDAGLPLRRAHDLAVRHMAGSLAAGVLQTVAALPRRVRDEAGLADLDVQLRAAQNVLGLVLRAAEVAGEGQEQPLARLAEVGG
jgi:hypothetical protein